MQHHGRMHYQKSSERKMIMEVLVMKILKLVWIPKRLSINSRFNTTESLCTSADKMVELTLQMIFSDIDPTNISLQKFWLEALRFLRWYIWRYTTDFESMMLMVARFGLTF